MTAVLTALVVIAVQGLAGAAWWALLRRSPSVVECVGMGLALGTFASMASAMALAQTPVAGVAWLIPAAATIPLVIARRHDLAMVRPRLPEITGAVIGLAAGVVLLVANWIRVPLDAAAPSSYADLHFFEALSRGLADDGPSQSILMAGSPVRYHWFTYAWAGSLSRAADTESFVAITRLLPLVTLIGIVLIVSAWSARLSTVRWVPALATVLVAVSGYAGALYGGILNFDSPSQSMTTLWLLALLLAVSRWTAAGGVWTLLAVLAMAIASTGGKVSHGVVAIGSVGLAALVGTISRAPWRNRSVLALAAVVAGFIATYFVVLSGVAIDANAADPLAVKASTWQGLDPTSGTLGVVLGTAALLLAVLARLAGLGWLLMTSAGRKEPDTWLATGGIVVGLAAMLALRQGINELWFILAASALGSVLSAVGVGAALTRVARLERHGPLRRPALCSVLVALPAASVCLLLSWTWPQGRFVLNWLAPISVWLLVPLGAVLAVVLIGRGPKPVLVATALSVAALTLTAVATRASSAWTSSRPVTTETGTLQPAPGQPASTPMDYADAVAAAAWLEDRPGALVATGDPSSALVPALAGTQMFLAGERYQTGFSLARDKETVTLRSEQSRDFATTPSATTAAPLCAAGVDYAWLPPSAGEVPEAALAYWSGTVRIVDMDEYC